jgi:hypothetical protein
MLVRQIRLIDRQVEDDGEPVAVDVPLGWSLLEVHPWRAASGALHVLVVLVSEPMMGRQPISEEQ